MGLFKRGNVWWAYFYIDGVRYQRSTGTGNKRLARTIYKKLREEAVARHMGVLPETDPNLTFAALAARFIAERQATNYHLGRLEMVLPYFGEHPVVRINQGLANRYRRRRHAQKPVTEATINRDLSVLRRILNWGVEEGLVAFNPLGRLRLVRERRVKRPVLGLTEERRLLAAAAQHLRPIIVTALDTGMRRGEILNESWEDVDFERNLLYVSRSKTPEGEAREIPLTRRLSEILNGQRQPEGTVFTFRSKPVRSLKTAWKTSLAKSGIRRLRFHDLRHTFNTRLMEAGVPQAVRMALMGHCTGPRMQAVYTHVELPVKREAVARLEAWVDRQTQNLKEDQ